MPTRTRAWLRSSSLLLAAASLASLTGMAVQAADIGRARLISGAGEPLKLIVPVTGLTAVDAATLAARIADSAAWQQNRLTPPAALTALRVDIEPGAHAQERYLLISATVAPAGEVVDMLLELTSASGQRRVQVSVAVSPSVAQSAASSAAGISLPRVGAAAQVRVRRGDVLWRIATAHQYDDVTIYQMLAAFYYANQPAFIRENMNWVRAGATLTVPDAATVRAIDPLAARRLFLAHQDVFFRTRAARKGIAAAAQVPASVAPPLPAPVEAPVEEAPEKLPASDASGDRVRLSGTALSAAFATADQAGDEAVARQRAERDAAQRVAQLQRNLDELAQALQSRAGANTAGANTHTEAGVQADENVATNAVAEAVGEGEDENGHPSAYRLQANEINANTNANATPRPALLATPVAQADSPPADSTLPNATPAPAPAAEPVTPRENVTTAATTAATTATISPAGNVTVLTPAATADAAWRAARRVANTPVAPATAPVLPQDGARRPASGAPANVRAASQTAPAALARADVASAQAAAITDISRAADTPAATPPAARAVVPQTAIAENTTAPPPAADKAPPQRPSLMPPMPAPTSHALSTPWLWAALGAALLAVIGWAARRGSKQRRFNADDDAFSPAHDAAMREQFARKLKTIDLNLDDASPDTPVSDVTPSNSTASNITVSNITAPR